MASYVAKVQFQNSLRRLSLGSDPSTLSYSQLVTRARDLFQIPSAADLTLTYVDRDGDVVTMVDDQDLQDALVMQSLNPLRLTVAVANSSAKSGAPESVAVKNVENDVAAGEAPSESVPAAGANVEKREVNDKSEPEVSTGPLGEAAPVAAESSAVDGKSSVDGSEAVASTNEKLPESPAKASSGEHVDPKTTTKAPEAGNESTDGEQAVHFGVICDGCGMKYIKGTRYKSVKKMDYDLCQACFEKPDVRRNEYIAFKRGRPSGIGMFRRGGCEPGGYARMAKGTTNESPAAAATEGAVFHYGVVCDECRTTPIVGPRFKSTKKENYDLCLSCMQKVESSASDEYARIDDPVAQIPQVILQEALRAFPPFAMFPFMPFGRPMCARRIYVPGCAPQEQEAASNQQKEVKNQEADQKAAETPESEKSQSQAHEAQETITVKATEGEKNLNASVEPSVDESKPLANKEFPESEGVAAQKQETPEDISSFEGMLGKLAAMGFTDSKLNEELLRKNNSDLRMTLDDLCAAEDWDPILEELQEMGFYDTDLNRRLLFQKDGNMKGVLKELVRMARLGISKSS